MSEKRFLNNYEKKIEKFNNINQSSELTGNDSVKKSEKQFLNYSESQKNASNLNQKDDTKLNIFLKEAENEKEIEKGKKPSEPQEDEENANNPENNENLGENMENPLIDEYMNNMLQNRDFSLNDIVDESALQDASKVLSNKEKYNIQHDENPFESNSNGTKYIFVGFKELY